jgi:hypothetical protein
LQGHYYTRDGVKDYVEDYGLLSENPNQVLRIKSLSRIEKKSDAQKKVK